MTSTVSDTATIQYGPLQPNQVEGFLQGLEQNPKVAAVELSRTHLRGNEAAQLFNCLAHLPQITRISLIGFTADEDAFAALAQAVANSDTLEILELECPGITDTQAEMLSGAIKANQAMKAFAFNCDSLSNEALGGICSGLSEGPSLETLQFVGKDFSIARGVTNEGPVRQVVLRRSDLDTATLQNVGRLLKQAQISHFNLEKVALNEGTAAVLGQAIESAADLQALDLVDCRITSKEAEFLAAAFKAHGQLKGLTISDKEADSHTLKILAKGAAELHHLKALNLSDCKLSGEAMEAWAEAACKANELSVLVLSDCGLQSADATALTRILQKQPLEGLTLDHNSFSGSERSRRDNGFGRIFKALAENHTLKKLSLFNCSLTPHAISQLARAIAPEDGNSQSEIESLYISANQVFGPATKGASKELKADLEDKGIENLRNLIGCLPKIQELWAQKCRLNDAAAEWIAEGIKAFQGDQLELHLDQNRIGSAGIQNIREAIGVIGNHPAVEVHLNQNKKGNLIKGLMKKEDIAGVQSDLDKRLNRLEDFFHQWAPEVLQEIGSRDDCEDDAALAKREKLLAAKQLELAQTVQEKMKPAIILSNCISKGILNEEDAQAIQVGFQGNYFSRDELTELLSCLENCEAQGEADPVRGLYRRVLEPVILATKCREEKLLSEDQLEHVATLLKQLATLPEDTKTAFVEGLRAVVQEAAA